MAEDRGEAEAGDEADPARPPECLPGQRDEQPREECETGNPRLRRDRHRRVVRRRLLRILPLQMHAISVRAFEASDADTAHRMRLRDANPVGYKARPPT